MKKIFSVLLSFILILISLAYTIYVDAEDAYLDPYGNWVFSTYESKLDENYYKTLDEIENKEDFLEELNRIISSNVTRLSYGTKTRDALKYIDEYPLDSSMVTCIYTGQPLDKNADGVTWNQEHLWVKSHGFPEGTCERFYAYSDLIHIHSSESHINTSRNNSDFNEDFVYIRLDEFGNKWTGLMFEPRDSVKGDIARSLLYMITRYQNYGINDDGLKLTLINSQSDISTLNGELGFKDVILKWHEEDPVDDYERRRNDRVEEIQGNRNPFIDHPEYANILYGCNYNQDDVYTVTYNTVLDATFNYSDLNRYSKLEKIAEPTVIPNAECYNFIGWYKDIELNEKWDFEKDTIDSNIMLYAKYEFNPTIEYLFKNSTVNKRLSFSYKLSNNSNIESKSMILTPNSGAGSISISRDSSIDLSNYFEYDNDLFKMEFYSNNKANCYIKPGEIKLYCGGGSGSEILIKSLSDSIILKGITYSTGPVPYIDVKTTNNQISIKNVSTKTSGDNCSISSFILDYDVVRENDIELKNERIDVMVEFDELLLNMIEEANSIISYGFIVDDEYFYIDKNDNKIEHFIDTNSITKEYRVSSFIEVDGLITESKENIISMKSLASSYYKMDELNDYKMVIEYISKYSK